MDNHRIMYYCTGDGPHRCYEDYLKYNFISAGQIGKGTTHKIFSQEIRNLKEGDYFFAYRKGIGYSAFGQILKSAVKIDDFIVDSSPGKKLYEIEDLKQKNIKENHDNEGSEYVCKVKWIKLFSDNDSINFNGTKYSSAFTSVTVGEFNTENRKYILQTLIDKFQIRNLFSNNFYISNQELNNMTKAKELAKLLKNTHNLILHGAPGTGKTYLAKNEIAPALAELLGASESEVGFVQFHPSYDYTDFVEGIRPRNSGAGATDGFERKDGVFKEFCEKALRNIIDSKKNQKEIEKEKSMDDKIDFFLDKSIDNGTAFETVTGNKFYITDSNEKNIYISIPANEKTKELVLQRRELLSLLNAEKNIENGNDIREYFGRKWRTQQDSYSIVLYKKIFENETISKKTQEVEKIEQKPYVFIIDEINRGELSKIFGELFFAIDPGYRGSKECKDLRTQYANLQDSQNLFDEVLGEKEEFGHFFIPENVYIIGTMNDIDRSVESMDLAMRRRFTFKEITAVDSAEAMLSKDNSAISDLDDSTIEELKNRMENLNNAIISDEIGLSSAYQIGAAYFLKYAMYKDEISPFDCLWEYNLEPLLQEYLRGQGDISNKMDKLKAAYSLN